MTARLTPLDRLTLVYVAAVTIGVGALWMDEVEHYWPWMLLAHCLLGVLALLAPRAREAGPTGRFLGDWYPLLLLGGLYGAIGVINLAEARAYDYVVQRLEDLVFGKQVSFDWIRAWPNQVASWALHICYLSYYPILYASPLGLWASGRRDAARETIFAMMATFYLCYVIFIFFPVTGPRYMFDLPHNGATDVPPARLAQWLLDHGDAWGAAFPSSHVAGSLVATMFAWRYWRPLGLVLAPFTFGLMFGVVYGQFHYAVDSIAGVVVALALYATVRVWSRAAVSPPLAGEALEPVRGEG